jgi:hypothetical protein
MGGPDSFTERIRGIRAGDAEAAAELVREYEPEIRVEVRVWLRTRHPGLRRVFDSLDICQSVLGSFLLRAAAGQYDLDQPEQLRRLLMGMARKKLAGQVKHHQRHRRDIRRVLSVGPAHEEMAAKGDSPSDLVAGKELLTEFRKRLTEEEQRLTEFRFQGWEWAAIAAELGGTAEARRKQLIRAVSRVARELGLEEPCPV